MGVGENLLEIEGDSTGSTSALALLNSELLRGWSALTSSGTVRGSRAAKPWPPSAPVPADAVRVFRGRKRAAVSRTDFVTKLSTVFMPMTVQMQRLYGLTAYLPAVLPEDKTHRLPDEVALVFYRTQGAYHEAKRCTGGRAYSVLHDLVFDMAASGSGFPQLFAGSVQPDTPYHLFPKSIDWQEGCARLFVGTRLASLSEQAFHSGIAAVAADVQRSAGDVDAVIFCAGGDWIVWWEHSPGPQGPVTQLYDVAETVLDRDARRVHVPSELTRPYSGLPLQANDFVSLHFTRA